MALGNSRPRNYGKEDQVMALNLICERRKVGYSVKQQKNKLFLKLFKQDRKTGIAFPAEWECEMVNEKRGQWKTYSSFDGSVIATGISQRDAIYKTIKKVWQ